MSNKLLLITKTIVERRGRNSNNSIVYDYSMVHEPIYSNYRKSIGVENIIGGGGFHYGADDLKDFNAKLVVEHDSLYYAEFATPEDMTYFILRFS